MSFAAPIFLTALLAGLVPVLLHMVNRQKAPLLPFSTLRFLRVSVHRTRRRKYLHDALLLLLRVAALALIAIGLAKPTVSRLHNLLGQRKATAVAIILDNSASMGLEDQNGPRWPSAQRAAEQLLDLVKDADSAALLTACGPPLPQAPRMYRNLETLRQSLSICKPNHQRADLAAALNEANRLLQTAEAPNKEVYVITDMQAVSWEGLKTKTRQNMATNPTPVIVVDIHGDPKPNVGLRRVELRWAAPVAGVPVQAVVELAGDAAVRQQRHVELLLDGAKHEVSPSLSVEPRANAQHSFGFVFDQPGLHRGELRLVGEDACTLDDRLYFAVDVNPNIPVAIVGPRDHEIAYLDDAYYLQRALAPAGESGWAVRTTRLTSADLATRSLAEFAVVFCVNLTPLETAAAQRLLDYALAGGRIVWICGDNVDPVAYSVMNEQARRQLLPLPLTRVREPPLDRPDGWRISWLDPAHPALKPLVEPASLYTSVLVQKHVAMEAPPARVDEGDTEKDGQDGKDGGVRVLARLDDGEALLVERAIGSGAVLLWGASLHVDWTNLPLRPIFLPLVTRLTFHLADARAVSPQLIAGTPLVVPLSGGARSVEIRLPSGNIERDTAGSEQDEFRYANTYDVGVYEVQLLGSARSRRQAFALNIDPGETDTAVLPFDRVSESFGGRPLVLCRELDKLPETVQRLREGESLWEFFLTAVLAALVAESFVANRRP